MVITLPFVLLLLDYWPLERMSFDGTQQRGQFKRRATGDAFEAGAGENPTARSLRGKFMDHANSPANGGARLRRILVGQPNPECGRGIRTLSLENGVACPARFLSAFHCRVAGMAMASIRCGLSRCYCVRNHLPQKALLAGWMVLVSGYFSSGHRPGAGGRVCHGRSLCLRSPDRNFRHDCLGSRRFGGGETCSRPSGVQFRQCAP